MAQISKYKFTVFFHGGSTIHVVIESESQFHATKAVKAMHPNAVSYLFTGKED